MVKENKKKPLSYLIPIGLEEGEWQEFGNKDSVSYGRKTRLTTCKRVLDSIQWLPEFEDHNIIVGSVHMVVGHIFSSR